MTSQPRDVIKKFTYIPRIRGGLNSVILIVHSDDRTKFLSNKNRPSASSALEFSQQFS
jgi:hypothetical protein